MDDYMSEKEQVEALRQWWNANGRYVIAGLVVGVAGVTGWQQWELHQTRLAQAASDSYEAVQQAVVAGDAEAAATLAETLRTAYPRTAYPAQAALLTAMAWVEASDLDRAATDLAWAMEHSGDAALAHVARLRLARVQLALGEVAAADATLAVESAGAFEPLFDEVRGDVAYARGDLAAARAAYARALEGMGSGIGDRQGVEMKMQDVTVVTVGAEPAVDADADMGADG